MESPNFLVLRMKVLLSPFFFRDRGLISLRPVNPNSPLGLPPGPRPVTCLVPIPPELPKASISRALSPTDRVQHLKPHPLLPEVGKAANDYWRPTATARCSTSLPISTVVADAHPCSCGPVPMLGTNCSRLVAHQLRATARGVAAERQPAGVLGV